MFTTREVIRLLRAANPEALITEGRVRHVLRRQEIPVPRSFAGTFLWTYAEIARLAERLGVECVVDGICSGCGSYAGRLWRVDEKTAQAVPIPQQQIGSDPWFCANCLGYDEDDDRLDLEEEE